MALPLAGALIAAAVFVLIQWWPRWFTPRPKIDWVDVPAGEFMMGSDLEVDPSTYGDEMPQHEVYLDTYRISKYEITNEQYRQCVHATFCEKPRDRVYYDDPNYADHPVVFVAWDDAQTFCKWVGGRLPMEAEWEYAARGPQGFIYPWGDEFDCSRGNFTGEACDGYGGTKPVGEFQVGASWCGVQDMAGNVWEWVADWYGGYPSTPQTNPTGPETGSLKVLRGGAWHLRSRIARSAHRSGYLPDLQNDYSGFRCRVAPTPLFP